MKIYLFSPLPPVPSGIAHYSHIISEELCLRHGYEVHVITNQREISVDHHYQIHHRDEFLYHEFPKEALCIYQIGNNRIHEFSYPYLFTFPGIIVLHDFLVGHGRMDPLIEYHTSEERAAEFSYSMGTERGKHLESCIQIGAWKDEMTFLVDLHKPFLEASVFTIVHNPDTQYMVQLTTPGVDVRCVPMCLKDSGTDSVISIEKRSEIKKRFL